MSEERPHEKREAEEHFGEASLGEAQSDEPALDPEMLEDADASSSTEELTDLPALEPVPVDALADEQEQAAAAEAGAIGGHTPTEGLPEAERPLAEGGEGEAEGFELAEAELIESASHGDASGHPLADRMPAEEAESEGLATYGEADHVEVSEDHLEDEQGGQR